MSLPRWTDPRFARYDQPSPLSVLTMFQPGGTGFLIRSSEMPVPVTFGYYSSHHISEWGKVPMLLRTLLLSVAEQDGMLVTQLSGN